MTTTADTSDGAVPALRSGNAVAPGAVPDGIELTLADGVAQLRLQVDHDFARGGQRPDKAGLLDKVFTVRCSVTHRH